MVWIPKLFVYNSLEVLCSCMVGYFWMTSRFKYFSLESKEMLTPNRADVRLYHDGAIKVNIPQYVSAICRIQTQSFPFDCQFCAVALASPLLNVDEMIVDATQPPKDSYFAGNAEWYLFNVTVRHMRFVEEGESRVEVSLGLGSLLAMTVLLGIVAGAMPKSNAIPLLGYYILIVILLCAVAVSISMAFLAISRQYIQKEEFLYENYTSYTFVKLYYTST
ncbi:hypothetical protein ANCCEY_02783 [Ancylostoma ceylanicum]|uniref:Neurotransmitter-gated ion-channel ligand-binding domain-containing protein n=1 Tax=Ancylostoma ceylanicum TaxID=53326 RepID=A0A0D6M3Q7_9BILA|nr:hypothetical protein ANCCEY_02783 [Ancylostoma ceylanicum]